MGAYPTGDAAIDALPVSVSSILGDASSGDSAPDIIERLREVLLFLAAEACDNGTSVRPGFVLSVPTPEIVGTTVLAVSPDVLSILGYADKAAYQAALNVPDFIHPADILSAQAHVVNGISAPYKLRLRKADLSYQRMLVRGITVGYQGKSYRVTILRREG